MDPRERVLHAVQVKRSWVRCAGNSFDLERAPLIFLGRRPAGCYVGPPFILIYSTLTRFDARWWPVPLNNSVDSEYLWNIDKEQFPSSHLECSLLYHSRCRNARRKIILQKCISTAPCVNIGRSHFCENDEWRYDVSHKILWQALFLLLPACSLLFSCIFASLNFLQTIVNIINVV